MNKEQLNSLNNIIFFDGVCHLCTWSVKFILKRDKKGKFRFSSLQSDFAIKHLKELKISSNKLNSIILIANHKIYTESEAILEITKSLSWFWPVLYFFKLIPKWFRNKIYQFIAKKRYRWFGKREVCYIPDKNISDKFL